MPSSGVTGPSSYHWILQRQLVDRSTGQGTSSFPWVVQHSVVARSNYQLASTGEVAAEVAGTFVAPLLFHLVVPAVAQLSP
jgi:hypothetical protein